MYKSFVFLWMLISCCAFAQEDVSKRTQPIVEEGKYLYRLEMASWYGTDVFLEKFKEREKVGGYFSYLEGETAKCVFFSNAEQPKAVGTISFDSTYQIATALTDLTAREFTGLEKELFTLRQNAIAAIRSDTIFKTYQNTNLNIIPLIYQGEKKVYVLTGTTESNIVIFGNDYLLNFDSNNQLTNKKTLHQNIIPVKYGTTKDGKLIVESYHSHAPETGDFMTVTDICTLMLYEKYTGWKQHKVVSKNYLNIWNAEKKELFVISHEILKKIEKDQEKRNKKREKENNKN